MKYKIKLILIIFFGHTVSYRGDNCREWYQIVENDVWICIFQFFGENVLGALTCSPRLCLQDAIVPKTQSEKMCMWKNFDKLSIFSDGEWKSCRVNKWISLCYSPQIQFSLLPYLTEIHKMCLDFSISRRKTRFWLELIFRCFVLSLSFTLASRQCGFFL